MAAGLLGSLCLLGCKRKVPTHTKTGICPTCLNNLGTWRRKTAAARLRYKDVLKLRSTRLEEVDQFPKGYAVTNGRFVAKKSKE